MFQEQFQAVCVDPDLNSSQDFHINASKCGCNPAPSILISASPFEYALVRSVDLRNGRPRLASCSLNAFSRGRFLDLVLQRPLSLNVMDGLSISFHRSPSSLPVESMDVLIGSNADSTIFGLELQFFGVQRYLGFDQFDSLIAGEFSKFR